MIGGWVYLMADRYRGTLYVGVTSDIAARVFAHRQGRGSAFCARYRLNRLVYVEQADDRRSDRPREGSQEVEPRLEDRTDRERQSGWEDLWSTINA